MYHGGLRTMLLEPAWRGVTDPTSCIAAADYRSRWQLAGQDAYDVVTEFQVKDGWVPGFKLQWKR